MNTINCRIKLNDHADVAGRNVTPAEVIVLRTLHDVHAGGCCIINPVAAGKAMTFIPASPGQEARVEERSDAEEYLRLRKKYPKREAPDKPNSSFLDPLFPGVRTGTGKLPRSFDELVEPYAIGTIGIPVETPTKTQDKAEPIPVSEAEGKALLAESQSQAKEAGGESGAESTEGIKTPTPTREMLEQYTKDDLLGVAEDYKVEVGGMKKAEIIDAILKRFAPPEPVTTE